MRIPVYSLPFELSEFHIGLTNYLLERVAHRLTEGVEAPFPAHELFRVIAERIEAGEKIEIFDDRTPEEPQPLPPTIEDINAAIASRTVWERIVDVFNPNPKGG